MAKPRIDWNTKGRAEAGSEVQDISSKSIKKDLSVKIAQEMGKTKDKPCKSY